MVSVAELRTQLRHLTTLADTELASLLAELKQDAYRGDALFDVLPGLIEKYGTAAASVTADWYDDLRLQVANAAKFSAIPADIRDNGAEALVGWAKSQTDDPAIFAQLVKGGALRRLQNYSRQTVMGSSIADPSSGGWRREGSGESCAFCLMLIGRGVVYSDATADFASHDHCNCMAVPTFKGESRNVLLDANGKRLTQSTRATRTDAEKRAADNERIRAWIDSHPNAG